MTTECRNQTPDKRIGWELMSAGFGKHVPEEPTKTQAVIDTNAASSFMMSEDCLWKSNLRKTKNTSGIKIKSNPLPGFLPGFSFIRSAVFELFPENKDVFHWDCLRSTELKEDLCGREERHIYKRLWFTQRVYSFLNFTLGCLDLNGVVRGCCGSADGTTFPQSQDDHLEHLGGLQGFRLNQV